MTTPAARPPALTITRQELEQKLTRHDPFKLVAAFSHWAFLAKHIPTSLHFDAPAPMYAALNKNDDIVVYCSNADCHASLALYYALLDHGYSNVRHYVGGLLDWEAAGLPVEGTWANSA